MCSRVQQVDNFFMFLLFFMLSLNFFCIFFIFMLLIGCTVKKKYVEANFVEIFILNNKYSSQPSQS